MKLSDITPATPIPTQAERYEPDPFYHDGITVFEPIECQACSEYVDALFEFDGWDMCETCLLREVSKANAEPMMTTKLIYGGL